MTRLMLPPMASPSISAVTTLFTSLVGQSLGAKRPDKAILYGSITQRLALVVSTVLFFVFLFGRRFLVGLFSQEEQIIAQGAVIMIMIAFTTHAQTSQVILSGCLRGAGDRKSTRLNSSHIL